MRREDIYSGMPLCYRWDITVRLPQGSQVSPEGLEKLNVNVENACGAFTARATAEDGALRIYAEKRIAHKLEPAENWEKLLEVLDAAAAYEALSIVIKK